MTTPGSDDRASPPDPRLDAAWRATSNERPPATLDAAIRSAARREVGARPHSARAQMPMDVHRRWWPLAAAATIAAIAVGVLELVTPDQLSAPPLDNATVTDLPPAAKPALDAMNPAPREEPAKQLAGNAATGSAASGGASPQVGAPRQEAASPRPAPRDDAATATASAQRRAPSAETPRIPTPFPAAPATSPRDSRASEAPSNASDVARTRASEVPSTPAAEAPSPASPPPVAAVAMAPAPTPASPPSPAAVPTPASASAPASAPALIGRMSERSAPLAKTATAGASAGQAVEARVKDGTPSLSIPDWIALIRRLRTEGKVPEAAKELAAFRAAHADHEKLLPADLRDWHPPAQ